ncbi:MAG: DUF4097 domain-containing protein [bacterium]
MKSKIFILMAVCTLLGFESGVSKEIKKVEEKTFKLKLNSSVTIIGDEGTIVVDSWDKNEAFLKITKKVWHRNEELAEELMNELEIEIEHSDTRLYIREIDYYHDHGGSFWDIFDDHRRRRRGEYQIDYKLTLPRQVNLKIENDEGDVEVKGLSGSARIKVDEGNIDLKKLTAIRLNIELDEGHLKAEDLGGKNTTFYANIDEGAVRLYNCELEECGLSSDEGDFILKGLKAKLLDVETDEGDIEAEVEIYKKGRCKFRTDEGDIEIYLPADIEADFRVETTEGRIRTDFPVEINRRGEDGERLDDRLGEGRVRIIAFTEEGNIFLRKW